MIDKKGPAHYTNIFLAPGPSAHKPGTDTTWVTFFKSTGNHKDYM